MPEIPLHNSFPIPASGPGCAGFASSRAIWSKTWKRVEPENKKQVVERTWKVESWRVKRWTVA